MYSFLKTEELRSMTGSFRAVTVASLGSCSSDLFPSFFPVITVKSDVFTCKLSGVREDLKLPCILNSNATETFCRQI